MFLSEVSSLGTQEGKRDFHLAQVLSAILQVLYTKHSKEAKTFLGSDPSISNECPKYKAEIFERKKLLSMDSRFTGLPKAEGGRTGGSSEIPTVTSQLLTAQSSLLRALEKPFSSSQPSP